jgi:transposase-like protein
MYGAGDVRVENVPGPTMKEPTDAVVRVLLSCICGSDRVALLVPSGDRARPLDQCRDPSPSTILTSALERGVEVDHVTVFRWVQRFTPLLADAARFARHSPGDRWHVDETYVKVNGVWRYVYRAVDQYGQVIDVLVSTRRDADAARRFFRRALRMLKVTPSEVVTDAAAVYPGVLDELIPSACHWYYCAIPASVYASSMSHASARNSSTGSFLAIWRKNGMYSCEGE